MPPESLAPAAPLPDRDHNLDILKAACITAVLLWHFQPLQPVLYYDNFLSQVTQTMGEGIKYQILLMAVPLLFIISLHLFFKKLNTTFQHLLKRIKSLLRLVLFWSSIQFGFYALTLWLNIADPHSIKSKFVFGSLESIVKILIGIAPSLPFVGDSVFYFLINLIILTALGSLYSRIPIKIRTQLGMPLIAAAAIYFELLTLLNLKTPYCFPDSFLVYIVVADMFTQQRDKLNRFKYAYLIMYVAFSIQDIALRTSDDILSIYARASILFGCLTVLTFIYPIKMKMPELFDKLSKYSLGIFAIHKYSQYVFSVLFLNVDMKIHLGIADLPVFPILVSIFAVLLTAYIIYVVKYTPLKRFIC